MLVYNEHQTIAEINEITDSTSNIKVGNQPKTSDKDPQNGINKNYTLWGICWKCGKFGHSAKECKNNSAMATEDQTYKSQTNI